MQAMMHRVAVLVAMGVGLFSNAALGAAPQDDPASVYSSLGKSLGGAAMMVGGALSVALLVFGVVALVWKRQGGAEMWDERKKPRSPDAPVWTPEMRKHPPPQ